MAIKLPPDFKEFLRLLNEHRVEYLLVGGYAVAYHGYPRATADMDVWIAVEPENAGKVVAALEAFGFPREALSESLFLETNRMIRMGVPPMRLEIATSISGVDFAACWASRIVETVDEVPVNIIDLSHLKANKKAAGRHKDLDDLEHLS